MGYSKKVSDKAAEIIRERHMKAERDCDFRRDMLFEKLPEAQEYERKIASCAIEAGRAVVKGGDVKTELEKLRVKSLSLQTEYEQFLAEHGYSIKDTEPDYFCKKCNDTGYVELDNRTVVCDCLKRTLVECACDELNRSSPLSLCTFRDFKLEYYSDVKDDEYPRSPRAQMRNHLDFCLKYAENFRKDSKSIFMKGKTGLGKTHLSLSIANEIIKKGFGVIYVSAPVLVSQLENERFSRDNKEFSVEQTVLDCDLLIIDDLGTEFTTSFSTTAIYNIFNSRLLMKKPMIINTNMSLQELEKTYNQRFVSRVIGEAVRLDFYGDDIRIKKK